MDGNFFLNKLLKEDSKTITKVYENSFPFVKKFVLQNNGNEDDAQDVFQKALLQIILRYKREKFSITGNFDAYFFTVCKNLWRRELNLHKKRVTNTDVSEPHSDYKDQIQALVEQKRHELFVEKLGELSDNCKKILTLFFAKTPYEEIVSTTEYNSELVVRQRVFKCKKRLKELIQKDKRFNSLKEL
ncbi:RNA polymerase sigma factor [Aquimarina rhabdastrellae]